MMRRTLSRLAWAAVLAAFLLPTPAHSQIQSAGSYPSASFARPANTTAYASGQLVANSTTASAVAPMQFSVSRVLPGDGRVRRVKLCNSSAVTTNASFRVHLYLSAPTPANGDGGPWSTSSASYIGSLDVTIDKAFTDMACGVGVPTVGSEVNFAIPNGGPYWTLYGLVEARAAYTPASGETISATLEVAQN